MRAVRRECPICEATFLRFARTRPGGRDLGVCPRCGSRQRHRHLWLWLRDRADLGGRVIHFAPEAPIERRLRATVAGYVTADLVPGADLQLDLQALDLPDASFDVVLCVHVLEHVPDDAAAMHELHRILEPGGWGIVQVPILRETTDEDPSVTDAQERLRRFGQADHVRVYGRDFADRLVTAGFELDVQRHKPPQRDIERYGLAYDLRQELGYDLNARPEPWEVWRVRSRA